MEKELFVSCVVGQEAVLLLELKELGYEAREGYGGAYVSYRNFEQVYELNFMLRTASRVLWPISTFDCYDREDLYNGVYAIDWGSYFSLMPTFAVDANVQHEAFPNSLFAARVVKDAICDQLVKRRGGRPNVDTQHPALRLNLFIEKEKAVLSFDTSGEPLHQRGYRIDGGKAPLRENLAAALLLMAGYRGDEIMVDPCCGSGTLLIEAAMIASRTPPGYLRESFGFVAHPEFDYQAWEKVRRKWLDKVIELPENHFYGIEVAPRAFQSLQRNLQKSGFSHTIQAYCNDFQKIELPIKPNFVMTNLPYGVRLQENERLEPLYKSVGDFLKQKTEKPARGFVFTGNLDLAKRVGLRTTKRHIVNNGGIECRLLEFDLY